MGLKCNYKHWLVYIRGIICGHLRDWLRNIICLGIVWDIFTILTTAGQHGIHHAAGQLRVLTKWSTHKISSWRYRFIPFDFTQLEKDLAVMQKNQKPLVWRTGVLKWEGYLTIHPHTAGTTIRLCIRIYEFLFVNYHSILGSLKKEEGCGPDELGHLDTNSASGPECSYERVSATKPPERTA